MFKALRESLKLCSVPAWSRDWNQLQPEPVGLFFIPNTLPFLLIQRGREMGMLQPPTAEGEQGKAKEKRLR